MAPDTSQRSGCAESMRTQVCITVDVEFSISGAFADPIGRQPAGPVSATCPVDAKIYPILKRLGIPLSSNIGLGAYRPEDPGLHLAGGRHWIDGVLELPVASHRYFNFGSYERWKTFTVIGTGADEAAEILHAA